MTRNDERVLCVGELVFDHYAEGPVLAGAPMHTAVHLARTGLRTALLTAVGEDAMGRQAQAFLAREGITGLRVHPSLPTGTVTVALEGDGVPVFTIGQPAAWTDLAGALPATPPPRPSLVVFCGLGLHPPGNRDLLQTLLAGWGEPMPTLCDLNLRPGWSDPAVARWCLAHSDVLKVNDEELAFLLQLEGLAGAPELRARHGLRGLCVTHGPQGATWHDPDGARTWPVPPGAAPVVDTVGAGDACTAALALGLLHGEPPKQFMERAGRWAARVCATRGGLAPV